MKNQKIIVLALVLLILAGIIVVVLKGFKVDFMLMQHDSLEYTISDGFEISDVENIAKEVFKDKKFKIRTIELFSDAVSINAEKITTDEAEELTKKLDEKYKKAEESAEATEETVTDYTIISNPKIKLVSLFKVFVKPSIIVGVIIALYTAIRYRKLNSIKTVLKLVGLVLVTVLSILSVIAIVRYPINTFVLPCIVAIVLFELVIFFNQKETELKKLSEEE